jgi:negative regulator of flagellin synthesis FlgM
MSSPINNLTASIYAPSTDSRSPAKVEQRSSAATRPAAPEDRNEVGEATRQAMASPEFDAAKVESIRRAISEGRYPLDPRRIAESFVALEMMIGPSGRSDEVGGQ